MVLRAVASILVPAVLFFLTTNFATWLIDIGRVHAAYSADWQGLSACFGRGIPFFRWMVEGDVAFSGRCSAVIRWSPPILPGVKWLPLIRPMWFLRADDSEFSVRASAISIRPRARLQFRSENLP